MLKYCIDLWEKNKENLRVAFEHCSIYSSYKDFSRLVIENIFPEWVDYKIDVHYYNSYSGDVVFFIHSNNMGRNDLFLSYLDYGSCSVCDTLMRAAESDRRVHDFMDLALHFIQNMIHPYHVYFYDKYDEVY